MPGVDEASEESLVPGGWTALWPGWHRRQRNVAGCRSRLLATVPCGSWQIRAVFANRRVFEGKRALLIRMALVAQQVNGRFLEVICFLTVGVVAVGAHHFPFLDGMVRGKCIQAIDFRMAFVARLGLLDGHHATAWAG